MMYLQEVLKTKEAKVAIFAGIIKLIETKDVDRGIDAMIEQGNRNGSWPIAKLAFVLDLLRFKF